MADKHNAMHNAYACHQSLTNELGVV